MKPISSKQQDFIAESIEAYKQKEALNRAKHKATHKATIAVIRLYIKQLIEMIGHDAYQFLVNKLPVSVSIQCGALHHIWIDDVIKIEFDHENSNWNAYRVIVSIYESSNVKRSFYVSSRKELQENLGAIYITKLLEMESHD